MNYFRHIFFVSLFLPMAGSCLIAKPYYVSPTGNDTYPGTIDSAFQTIPQAVSVVLAGDTIFVRGGTYMISTTILISKSGTSNKRYYLFAYPGDIVRPVLNYSTQPFGSSNRGIVLSGSYWYFKGIDIFKAGDNGLYISGSNNIIEFCSFYENQDSGLQLSGGAANNQVVNCDSYFNADPTDYGDADGFACKMDVGTGNYFYGCRSWLNVDDGWDGYLRGATGVTTTLENCWTWRNGYFKNGTDAGANANGNGFKMGGSDTKDLVHNFIVKNCLAFQNKAKGFDQNSNAGSITLYNCTAYMNGGKDYMLNSSPVTYDPTSVFTVTNCAALGTTGTSFRTGTVLTTNNFSTVTSDYESLDTIGICGLRKPDGSLPDVTFMHLAAGSPLIDHGTDVGLTYSGIAPDLGAFEYPLPPLPVEMTALELRIENTNIFFLWKTISEINCYGFEVERRTVKNEESAACRWEKRGFLYGSGTSNSIKEYSFGDQNILPGKYMYRIRQIDQDGTFRYSASLEVDLKENNLSPKNFTLGQNYPNPFNPTTKIEFSIPVESDIKLEVYDIIGRKISTLMQGVKTPGDYSMVLDASHLCSGMYIYTLSSSAHVLTKKMLLLK
jgi:hypothetical protein